MFNVALLIVPFTENPKSTNISVIILDLYFYIFFHFSSTFFPLSIFLFDNTVWPGHCVRIVLASNAKKWLIGLLPYIMHASDKFSQPLN